MKFINIDAGQAVDVSSGIFSAIKSVFSSSKEPTEEEKAEEERKCVEGYGMGLEAKAAVDKLAFRCFFAEETAGANDEARLCIKSVKGTGWGACEDYEKCVGYLAGVWEKSVEQGGKKLQIFVVLPEEDIMVGEKGMKYFEECWGEDKRGKGIEVDVVRVKGTDHDSSANANGVELPKLLKRMKALP